VNQKGSTRAILRRHSSEMAKALWSSSSAEEWQGHLSALESRFGAKKTKYGTLADLQTQFQALCDRLAAADGPKELSKDDLVMVMGYKLTRGKMRPLMNKIVEGTSETGVREATRAALAALDDEGGGDDKAAFKALDQLHGVGVATASMILAAAAPSQHVVMSDQSMEAILDAPAHGKKYDLKSYAALRDACVAKATALGGDWTAYAVEQSLYSAAAAALAVDVAAAAPSAASASAAAASTKPAKKPSKRPASKPAAKKARKA